MSPSDSPHDTSSPVSSAARAPQDAFPVPTDNRSKSPLPVLILLMLALLGMILVDVWMGEASVARIVTPSSVLRVFLSHAPLISAHFPAPDPSIDSIVWSIRLPRVLGGALIGMLLHWREWHFRVSCSIRWRTPILWEYRPEQD